MQNKASSWETPKVDIHTDTVAANQEAQDWLTVPSSWEPL